MTLIQKLEKATNDLRAGVFGGNMIALLEESTSELRKKQEERQEIAAYNARQAFEAYRGFYDRLNEIVREIITADHPTADCIWVRNWMIMGRSAEPGPGRLSVEVGFKEYVEDEYGDMNETKEQVKYSVVVDEDWLLGDDSWKAKAAAMKLRHDLHMAKYHLENDVKAVPEAHERLERVQAQLAKRRQEIMALEAKIAAMPEEVA
jgi:hypothetical protein